VSSNSSGRDGSLRALLNESFVVLLREVAPAHQRMCAALDGMTVAITVDGEAVDVKSDGRAMRVRSLKRDQKITVEITTARAAILDVLHGRTTLTAAVLADSVRARASLDSLVRLNHGLAMYVHGAVRAPSFPAILERFELGCRRSPSRNAASYPRAANAPPNHGADDLATLRDLQHLRETLEQLVRSTGAG
jgi:hypothetical protein